MPPKLWIPSNQQTIKIEKHLTQSVRSKEALSLYREILRTAKHFHWSDNVASNNSNASPSNASNSTSTGTGMPWNLKLKQMARKEFEESRQETDPLIIARLLITGRDCLQQIQQKFNDATVAAWKRIETDNTPHTRK